MLLSLLLDTVRTFSCWVRFMNRRVLYGLFGALSLSLVAGVGLPHITPTAAEYIAAEYTVQAQTIESTMTVSRLDAILQEEASRVEGGNGQWQAVVGDRTLIILADANNNRMRIFTPVIPASELTAPQIQAMLLANFHTALDARYALTEDAVVASFVHPLTSLDETYLRSALSQVATLADNFGTSYSSGAIGFGPAGQSDSSPASSDGSLAI